MQRIFLTTCFFIFSTIYLSAQEILDAVWLVRDTTSVQYGKTASWKKGESGKFRMTYYKNQFSGDSLISEKKVSDNISTFKVISKAEDAFIMEYEILENLKFKDDMNAVKNLGDEGESLLSDIHDSDFVITYKTDLSGSFLEYVEPQKTIDACNRIMEKVKKSNLASAGQLTKKQKAKSEALLNLIGSGEVLFEKMFQVFISHFHNMYGFQLGIDDTLSYTEKTKPVVKDQGNSLYSLIYVNSIDTTNNDFEIVLTQEFDEEILTKLTKSVLKSSLGMKDVNSLSVSGFIKAQYFFNPTSTWPQYIKITKEVTTSEKGNPVDQTNQEVWVINSDYSVD